MLPGAGGTGKGCVAVLEEMTCDHLSAAEDHFSQLGEHLNTQEVFEKANHHQQSEPPVQSNSCKLPSNSLDDSRRDICLMDASLFDYWPSIMTPDQLLYQDCASHAPKDGPAAELKAAMSPEEFTEQVNYMR